MTRGIQMKAVDVEQYFQVVLLIKLCKVDSTFKSVDKTLVGYCVAIQCNLFSRWSV